MLASPGVIFKIAAMSKRWWLHSPTIRCAQADPLSPAVDLHKGEPLCLWDDSASGYLMSGNTSWRTRVDSSALVMTRVCVIRRSSTSSG